MSKNVFVILLMCLATFMGAQTIAPKKCNTCGKPLAQCQYKGKHPKQTKGVINGHEWIDLGLPSGTKWATMNIGASSPSDYGNYYAWGEVRPKEKYTVDNLSYTGTKIDLKHDAASANWGAEWRLPTRKELLELINKCIWKWTGGGYEVKGPNGNIIFLPAAGCYYESLEDRGKQAIYRTSTTYYKELPYQSYTLYFGDFFIEKDWCGEPYLGYSVRAVIR